MLSARLRWLPAMKAPDVAPCTNPSGSKCNRYVCADYWSSEGIPKQVEHFVTPSLIRNIQTPRGAAVPHSLHG